MWGDQETKIEKANIGKLLKGTIGEIKAKLAYSSRAKHRLLRKLSRNSEESGPGVVSTEEPLGDTAEREKSGRSAAGKEAEEGGKGSTMDSKGITGASMQSPLRKKRKAKSRQTSRKPRKRTRSNKPAEKRKRKFSVSEDEEEKTGKHISPFTKVPHNTLTKQFYSKRPRQRNRLKTTEDRASPLRKRPKSGAKKKKVPSSQVYASQKKRGKGKGAKESREVRLEGGADLSAETLNLMIGAKDSEISQVYSKMGADFGEKFVVLLRSVKFGFDLDYVTGIQAEYLVGDRLAVEAFLGDPSAAEVLKIDDPSKIKGNRRFERDFAIRWLFSDGGCEEVPGRRVNPVKARTAQAKLPAVQTRVAAFDAEQPVLAKRRCQTALALLLSNEVDGAVLELQGNDAFPG